VIQEVLHADFGAGNKQTCERNAQCTADVAAVLRSHCVGKTECHLTASDAFFGVSATSQCAGVESKYLLAKLRCGPAGVDARYTLTFDDFSAHTAQWRSSLLSGAAALHPERDATHVLELGCFEGGTSLWMLDNLVRHPESSLVVIDRFATDLQDVRFCRRFCLFVYAVCCVGLANRIRHRHR
jgi:hypothetical protein